MNELQELRDLGKPLKKGDFLIFQYEVRKDFYLALTFFMGTVTIGLIAAGIYNFFTENAYYGFDKITLAAIAILMGRSGFQHWSAIGKKIDTIEEKMQKS